jgi:predicted nucleic acid-binding protein
LSDSHSSFSSTPLAILPLPIGLRSAVTFVRSNEVPLVTTDLIVVETLNLVQARLGHRHAVQVGKRLLNPATTTVLKVSDQDVRQAWLLFQRYRDKEFSFTDCTTFALMARLQISTAFAFDIHFRQYGRCIVVPEEEQD